MQRKRLMRIFKRLNPKDLAKEVHIYGYDFSWKTHIKILIGSVLSISAIGWLFRLDTIYYISILFVLLLVLPTLVVNSYKRMFEQKRFADASLYAEQMLYSFQKNGKIAASLKETMELFEDGRMRWSIEDAISYMEAGIAKTEAGTLQEALAFIEKKYLCRKIQMVHELLTNCEEFGGDAKTSILILLEDIELWKRRCYKLQADKKICHTDNMISIAVATVLCAIALYVLDAMGTMVPHTTHVAIFSNPVIQLSSFIFVFFMIGVFAKSMKCMTVNWLNEDERKDEKYLLDSYRLVTDAKKYKRNRTFGYSMARKDVSEALYMVFPEWMMEMALLLQHNNVQVSIEKSIGKAPRLMQLELEQLQKRLQENPEKLRSYTDFWKDFDIPEAQSVMKMLHAIAENGTGDIGVQMHNLINRVQEMQHMADDLHSKRIVFQMRMIFMHPVLAATIKLMLDLTIGMLYMLNTMGNMGGM